MSLAEFLILLEKVCSKDSHTDTGYITERSHVQDSNYRNTGCVSGTGVMGEVSQLSQLRRSCYCHVNLRFLLILSNDVESNPGPTVCPCDEAGKSHRKLVECSKCKQKWHRECIGLKELPDSSVDKLVTWTCALCIVLPEKIQKLLYAKLMSTEDSVDEK